MAFVIKDRVKETTTTTGTGTLTLDGAATGFETFSGALGNTNTTYYAIASQNSGDFEVGIGTVGAGTLSRDTVISSSNSDALVNFSAGTKDVFVTLPASKTILLNDSDTVDLTGNLDLNSNDITGTGNINITGNLTASGNLTSLGIDDNATSTAITIDSSENVGIGTASPNNQLEIKSDTATVVARLACNTGTGRDWGVASATDGAFGIYDYDATAYRMRIDSSGNVGIGTTAPEVPLSVVGLDTQIHFSESADSGGYLMSEAAGQFRISGGAAFKVGNTNWTAKSTEAAIIGHDSGGDIKFFSNTGLTVGNNFTPSERMRIDSSGNVGIGTSSPATDFSKVLHISGASAATATTGGSRLFYTGTNGSGNWSVYDGTAAAYRAIIDSSGNVGIGTSSPNNQLEIKSDTATVVARLACNTGTGRDWGVASATDGAFGIYDYDAAAYRMRIDSSGNVGIGTTSPNAFAKLHIVDGAGTLPAMAAGDVLTIQNNNDISDNAGLTAISGTSGISYVQFGDSADKNPGAVYYYNTDDSMRFLANASERMRINSSGDVGIGTSSPAAKLSVDGSAIFNESGADVDFRVEGDTNANLLFVDASTDKVGIGVSNPSALLDVTNTDTTSATSSSLPTQMRVFNLSTSANVSAGIAFGCRSSSTHYSVIENISAGAQLSTLVFKTENNNVVGERMRIDSPGNVGIGTSSPDAKLSVDGVASFGDGTALLPSIANFGDLNTGMWFPAADTIAFSEGGTERMRISSTGNIGMGDVTTPISTDATLNIDQIGSGFPILCHRDGTGDGVQISFHNDNGQVGRINTNGSATSYTTSSDYRLKENVNYDFDATTRLKQLKPARFNFIADT
jgi:hypothetical protein